MPRLPAPSRHDEQKCLQTPLMSLGTGKTGTQNNPQVRTTASQQWLSIFAWECLQGNSQSLEKYLKTLWLTFPIIPDITETGESNFSSTTMTHTPWKLFTVSVLLKHQLCQYMKSVSLGLPTCLSLPDYRFCKDRATSYPQVCTWSPTECLENSIFSVKVYWLVDYNNKWMT